MLCYTSDEVFELATAGQPHPTAVNTLTHLQHSPKPNSSNELGDREAHVTSGEGGDMVDG